jgi:hydrogenase maturation protein HypF
MSSRCWRVYGQVQGVGFRPFVYRLAHEYGLRGWVKNLGGAVEIVAWGDIAALDAFAQAVITHAPPLAQPTLEQHALPPLPSQELTEFMILASAVTQQPHIHVPPDYFTCDDCVAELNDPHDRRYHYPFINCTQCGPRYTLMLRLPYDRPHTTMADFPLCPTCSHEYSNPIDRRFHAQPLACPVCGPQLDFYPLDTFSPLSALEATVAALRQGNIVAVKGIGGYHLLCDAKNHATVLRLRTRKARPDKPLALMFPHSGHDGLACVRTYTDISAVESKALCSPQRPIVTLALRPHTPLSPAIAPRLNAIGVMLPYSPLHHLLLQQFGAPLVATSANLSGEPVLTDKASVVARLGQIAEAFLHHNRPIARPADDPVLRQIGDKMRPLRLGRGTAPLELNLPWRLKNPMLALGGHLKNTLALAWEQRVVISPHIGDLDSPRALEVFQQVITDLQALYQIKATELVCDAHPHYASSRWAARSPLPVHQVWHHHAHASAVAGEYPEVKTWIMFTWDGVGLGSDATLWGGDMLCGAPGRWLRHGHWRPFRLLAADKAGRAPWRSAAALCWELGLKWEAPPGLDVDLLWHAWQKNLNCTTTTAVGRLFDAAAALLGICTETSYEGQAPLELESIATQYCATVRTPAASLSLALHKVQDLWITDWAALLPLLCDKHRSIGERAALFHHALAAALCAQAQQQRQLNAINNVGLCGGVFQNRLLTELVLSQLHAAGFAVYLGAKIPMNDAGLSFGQIIEAGACCSHEIW